MKIVIIGDTHFGARGDSIQFDDFFKKFYEETFFPYLDSTGIKTVIHLGDVFDRRKYINFQILSSCKKYFFDQLKSRGIEMITIIGNHDTHFKNTNEVNSPRLLLREYDNIEVIDTPTEKVLDGMKFSFIPWVCPENEEQIKKFMSSHTGICIGHFEFDGFEMSKGISHEGGLNRSAVSGYDAVFTGHFHHKSSQDNVFYLGSPYQFTWSDYEDDRGFHEFDTRTLDLKFIKNPNIMFHKIYYDDSKKKDIDANNYKKTSTKLIVEKKKDFLKFDMLLETFYANEMVEFIVHDDFTDFDASLQDTNVKAEDTLTLLLGFVDGTDTSLDKDKIKSVMKKLYVEAQHIDSI